MKNTLLMFLYFFLIQTIFSQEVTKNYFRIGFGSQRNFFSEIGYQYLINETVKNGCIYSYSPSAVYLTIEWTPKSANFNDVYALKIGYEKMLSVLLSYAIEVKYQTNSNSRDFVITPKIGLFATARYSVFYGYNISTNGKPFGNVGNHQFSLIFNLNATSFEREKPPEPYKIKENK